MSIGKDDICLGAPVFPGHEWIVVGNRRWCAKCGAKQWQSGKNVTWQPRKTEEQPCDEA